MNNKKQKKVIITILIIFVIFALGLIILDKTVLQGENNTPNNPSSKPNDPSKPTNPDDPNRPETELNVTFNLLKDASEFFTISKNINDYLQHIADQNSEAVYNILSKKYTGTNNISASNALIETVPKDNPFSYTATKIYSYDYNDFISVYYVYGEVTTDTSLDPNTKSETVKKYHLVILDSENYVYSITPLKNEEEINQMRNNTKKSTIDYKIAKNSHNTFKFQNISNDTIVSTYYYRYLDKLINDKEEAYEMLNESYKEKRFSDYNKFLNYLDSNLENIVAANVTSYRLVNSFNNIYYVYNTNGDVFVFREKSIMQFEVYLDDKTVTI